MISFALADTISRLSIMGRLACIILLLISTTAITAECIMPVSRATAIVIGAGPAGLATSLSLSKICDRVLLVEKHETFDNRGASIGLAPNAIKALPEIYPGVQQDMELVGIPTPANGLLLPWYEMRNVLLNAVQKKENIELYVGERLVEIVDDVNEDIVCLRFESGRELQADFCVGADGVHSTTRSLLGLPPAIKTGQTIFRGHVCIDGPANPLYPLLQRGMVVIPNTIYDGVFVLALSFEPKIPGKVSWIVSTRQPRTEGMSPLTVLEGRVADEEEWTMLKELFARSDPVHMTPFAETSVVDFSKEATTHHGWGGKQRVTLVGDAAHAMRPTDGYGVSMAFEDAVMLCRSLVVTTSPSDDTTSSNSKSFEASLRLFEAERLPRVQKIHQDQEERYARRLRKEEIPYPEGFREWIHDGI
jgi:salicylate hydroxylase